MRPSSQTTEVRDDDRKAFAKAKGATVVFDSTCAVVNDLDGGEQGVVAQV